MLTTSQLARTLRETRPEIETRFGQACTDRFTVDHLYQVTCIKAHVSRADVILEEPAVIREWIIGIAKQSVAIAHR